MNETGNSFLVMTREENFSAFLKNAPVGIILFNSNWDVTFYNESFIDFGILYHFKNENPRTLNIYNDNVFYGGSIKDELAGLREGRSFAKELFNIPVAGGGKISLIVKGSPLFENEIFSGGTLLIEDFKLVKDAAADPLSTSDFEKALNNVNDFLFITGTGGDVVHSYGKKLYQLPNTDTIFNIKDLFDLSAATELDKNIREVKQTRRPQQVTLELTLKNERLLFDLQIEPVTSPQGKTKYLFFFLNDITGIKLENTLLKEQVGELNRDRSIWEKAADAVIVAGSDGKIITLSKPAEHLFNISKNDAKGKFCGKLLHLFDAEYFNDIKGKISGGKPFRENFTYTVAPGRTEVFELRFSSAAEETVLIVFNTVTEKAIFDENLRNAEAKLREMLLNSRELICMIEPEGKISHANDNFNAFFGIKDNIKNKNFKDILLPSSLKMFESSLRNYNSVKFPVELQAVVPDGGTAVLSATFSPLFEKQGKIKYFNANLVDITWKKRIENDLAVYRSLFEFSNDGIAVILNDKIVLVNQHFVQLFGYENENIDGKPLTNFAAEKDREKILEYINNPCAAKPSFGRIEFLAVKKDGSTFFADGNGSSFALEDKCYTLFVLSDITERKRSQIALKESEEKYRNITENIDDFLYTLERTDNILRPIFYSSSVEKITGYTQADFLIDSKLFLKIAHPDDFPALVRKLKIVFHSLIQASEEFEFRIINKHGNIVWIRNKVNLVKGRDGKIQKIYGLVSDITPRKKAEDELKKSTDNLLKLNETKDRFISIISHDLRTPFSSILGFTDLLLSDETLNEDERRQYVRFIQDSSKSMLALVNSLLDWTRLQTGRIKFEPEKIDASALVEDSINALSGAAFQKDIALDNQIEKEVFVFGDRNLIIQVFNNLISNAIKFTNPGGTITFSAVHSKENHRFIEFAVKDNGVGIREENIENLFRVDSKFSSEGTAGERGSGLGLSLVKEIIEKHNGNIKVESIYGAGSTFTFTLPVASANILLVDDNKTDRILYSKILKNITPDYNIDIASDGKEAYEKILEASPALVISEHLMPEMSGLDMINEIKKLDLKAKPPIIILSSNISRNVRSDYNDLGIEYVFQKPVNLSIFKQAVEKSLRKGLGN